MSVCIFIGSTLQDKEEEPVPSETGQHHPFFRRSDSMTFLGCIPPNPFEVPVAEAIPLADQPHLLQVSCLTLSKPAVFVTLYEHKDLSNFIVLVLVRIRDGFYCCFLKYMFILLIIAKR